MPASTMDPISSTLKQAFRSSGSIKSLDSGLAASAKKSLMNTPVIYTQPVKHLENGLAALKNRTVILLNPVRKTPVGEENGDCDKKNWDSPDKNSLVSIDSPPKPKVIYFPLNAVEVGYKSLRRAGAGMFNMGNTCYLNSTLQALFHTPSLYNYLMSGSHLKQCKSSNGYIQSCMICTLITTLKETLENKVMRPSRVYEKLKMICKHLVHGRQEDAHEFLKYLIESLQRSFLTSCQVPKSIDNASKETTPFNQIFGGYMRQDVTCLKCKFVSTTFQHFMDLVLDIRQASTIEEALINYFRAERLGDGEGINTYKCEKCKIKVPAKKKYFVARPPIVLCIQLKRFSFMGAKIHRPVQLNRKINLQNFLKNPNNSHCSTNNPNQPSSLQYRLVSMITHVGPSPNCGHYTAIGEAVNGQFFQFDDSSVRPIPVNQVLNTASYVVFYEMTKPTKQTWASPPSCPSPVVTSTSTSTVTSSSTSKSFSGSTPSIWQKSSVKNVLKSSNGVTAPCNKVGVVISKPSGSQSPRKRSLVPYNEDSSDSEGSSNNNSALTPVKKASLLGKANDFIPRPLIVKSNPNPTVKSNLSALDLNISTRPSSAASNASGESNTYSRSGVWTITDNENHTPSIHSDNSTGSTTNNWMVTQRAGETKAVTQDIAPINLPALSASCSSTPEKKHVKRSSSIEEYEADLDRGRSKKVKKKHFNSSFNKNQEQRNPFQSQQNWNYSDHHRNDYSRSSSNSNRKPWTNNHHRDHSYHATSRRDSGEGQRYNYFNKSYSSSSLDRKSGNFYRDKHRRNSNHWRQNSNHYHGNKFSDRRDKIRRYP